MLQLIPIPIQLVASFVLSWMIVKYFLSVFKQQFLDTPNTRSSHKIATPRGGGVSTLYLGGGCMGAVWDGWMVDRVGWDDVRERGCLGVLGSILGRGDWDVLLAVAERVEG